jgi:hypothetical protein
VGNKCTTKITNTAGTVGGGGGGGDNGAKGGDGLIVFAWYGSDISTTGCD